MKMIPKRQNIGSAQGPTTPGLLEAVNGNLRKNPVRVRALRFDGSQVTVPENLMDKFVVRGGNPLIGSIRVSGAKNAALPAMAAAILTEEPVVLENIPDVRDIQTERNLLVSMGAEVELGYGRASHRTTMCCRNLVNPEAAYELVKTMRASSLVLGPLVARMGRARVSLPGGCAIGARPIDLHITGLEKLGADHHPGARLHRSRAPERLRGGAHQLRQDHRHRHRRPHDGRDPGRRRNRHAKIARASLKSSTWPSCSIKMGAKIEGAGTSTIRIQGVEQTRRRRAPHHSRPHRSRNIRHRGRSYRRRPHRDRLRSDTSRLAVAKLRRLRRDVSHRPRIHPRARDGHGSAADITTEEYPGFPTDLQAQYMALLTQAEGISIVTETIFENRFMHAQELARMGANIRVEGHRAVIRGTHSAQRRRRSYALTCAPPPHW